MSADAGGLLNARRRSEWPLKCDLQTPGKAPPSFGVGLLGTGGIGRSHLRAWRLLGDTEQYAGVKVVAQGGRSGDWRDVVFDERVDIVDICAPDALHREMLETALQAGKHVVCEKPLWLGDAGPELAQLAGDKGLTVSVCFVYRHVPAVSYARHLIRRNAIGGVIEFHATYLQEWALDRRFLGWRHSPDGSGVIGDLGSHLLDTANYLIPDFTPAQVNAAGSTDLAMRASWVTLSGRISGTFAVSRTARGHDNDLSFEILGETGAIRLSTERPAELLLTTVDHPGASALVRVDETARRNYLEEWWAPGSELGWGNIFVHQLADAVDRMRGRQVGSADLEDGLIADRLGDDIRLAAGKDSLPE